MSMTPRRPTPDDDVSIVSALIVLAVASLFVLMTLLVWGCNASPPPPVPVQQHPIRLPDAWIDSVSHLPETIVGDGDPTPLR